MDTQRFSDDINKSKHLVEARELWGFKYYIEVESTDKSVSPRQVLELTDTANNLYTDVFGGEKLD